MFLRLFVASPIYMERGNAYFFAIPIQRPIPELAAVHINFDFGQLLQISLDERFRQWIFDITLNRAAQRPGAVILVTAGFIENPLFCVIGDSDLEPFVGEVFVELGDHHDHDTA